MGDREARRGSSRSVGDSPGRVDASGSSADLAGNAATPYARAQDHLDDELGWLDLLIRARVLRGRERLRERPAELLGLEGLVISDEEISELLEPPERRVELDDTVAGLAAEAASLRRTIDQRVDATLEERFLPLPYLSRLFQLTRAEERALVVCLGSEIHRRYDKLYAFLHDDVTRRRPSVELAAGLLLGGDAEGAIRTFFHPMAPLCRYRLVSVVETDPPQPLRARSLVLDERVAGFLQANRLADPRIAEWVGWVQPGEPGPGVRVEERLAEEFRRSVRGYFGDGAEGRPNLVLHLRGAEGTGRRHLAACLGEELGLPLLRVDAERAAIADRPLDEILWRAARESLLQPAVLVVERFDVLLAEQLRPKQALRALLDAVPEFCRCAVLVGEQRVDLTGSLGEALFVRIDVPESGEGEMARYWRERAGRIHPSTDALALESLAGRFHFHRGHADRALRAAHARAVWRSPSDVGVTRDDVLTACRSVSSSDLGRMARKIEPRYRWRDLVLPEAPLRHLRGIAAQVRHRHVVLGDWGFGRKLSLGKGVSALFAGPPGTGKTMAAEVVAADLGLELYKIDLSQVVSKYIGETEKNLDAVFDAAERASAILFFDEADALFGKRSEVRDSHDRYANVEVSYLLQKMEEYQGIAVLATNLRRHLDEAFFRRLQFVIEFPFPSREDREAIWRVTLPAELPVDDEVDLEVLARDVRLAGGGIKNICVAAAHLAAADGGRVTMEHLWEASHYEYEKLGRAFDPGRRGETGSTGGSRRPGEGDPTGGARRPAEPPARVDR